MDQLKTMAPVLAAILSCAAFCAQGLAETPATPTVCTALPDGVEYRAFLPDKKRFVYLAVKVLPGVFPSVFVIADKNYLGTSKIAANDPLNRWWIDRTRTMLFSTDTVRIRWQKSGTLTYMINWFEDPPPEEFSQKIRGLEPAGGKFAGTGSTDTNTFAFQTRIEMNGFSGDMFEVKLPDLSYDGVTVSPPVVHFDRDGKNATAKC